MNIKIHSLVDGSKNATGIVVIIDVLRACTTIPVLLKQGITEIIPVKSLEDAESYKDKDFVLIGEGEHGSVHDIFDYNNSPSEVLNKDFSGKNAVLRSNNATQAIHFAEHASDVVLASFLNISAIVGYIKGHHLDEVTIVPLGRLGNKGIEDELCAEVIQCELEGKSYDFDSMRQEIRECETAVLVRETLQRPEDVEIALQLNSYNIVPRVFNEDNTKVIRQVI